MSKKISSDSVTVSRAELAAMMARLEAAEKAAAGTVPAKAKVAPVLPRIERGSYTGPEGRNGRPSWQSAPDGDLLGIVLPDDSAPSVAFGQRKARAFALAAQHGLIEEIKKFLAA